MLKYAVSGCAYRFPEPDDPMRPMEIASSYNTLRIWQVRQLVPLIVGLPIRVNHRINAVLRDPVSGASQGTSPEITSYFGQLKRSVLTNPTARPCAVAGTRPLGIITRAWLNAAGALFWSGIIEFRKEDSSLLCLYRCNMLSQCSLQHTIFNAFTDRHRIVPVEISLCYQGYRSGTDVDISGDTAGYMRKNGYGTNCMAMLTDPLLLPPAADTMIQYAAQVSELQAKSRHDSELLAELGQKLKYSEEQRIYTEKLLNEDAEAERDSLAAQATLFTDLCTQLFPDHPMTFPISIMASVDPKDRKRYKEFKNQLTLNIAKLTQVQSSKALLEAASSKFNAGIATPSTAPQAKFTTGITPIHVAASVSAMTPPPAKVARMNEAYTMTGAIVDAAVPRSQSKFVENYSIEEPRKPMATY